MMTVRLLGGLAHGWTCTVVNDTHRIYVSMLTGRAQFVRTLNQNAAGALLKRSAGTWETYTHCLGFFPDASGTHVFQCTHALPDPDDQTPTRLVNAFLATRRSRPVNAAINAARWAQLDRMLRGTAFALPSAGDAAWIGKRIHSRNDPVRRELARLSNPCDQPAERTTDDAHRLARIEVLLSGRDPS